MDAVKDSYASSEIAIVLMLTERAVSPTPCSRLWPWRSFRAALTPAPVWVAKVIDRARASYLPFLRETIERPYEVWTAFERNRLTGQVRMATRFVKRMVLRDKKGMLLVAQASKGCLEAWTAIPVSASGYLQKQRTGLLLWGR